MKQNKLVIVLLVVLAIAFAIGLGSGVFRENGENDSELTMSKAKTYQDRWVSSLKKKLSFFSEPLDKRRLNRRAKCQTADRTYKLTDGKECSVSIAASSDGENIEEATLTVEGNNAKLFVAYPGTGDCKSDRGMKTAFKTIKTPKVAVGIGKIKQPNVKKDPSPPQLELVVAFMPGGTREVEESYCQAVKEVKLSVIEKGGTIKLKCNGCDARKKKSVIVKLN